MEPRSPHWLIPSQQINCCGAILVHGFGPETPGHDAMYRASDPTKFDIEDISKSITDYTAFFRKCGIWPGFPHGNVRSHAVAYLNQYQVGKFGAILEAAGWCVMSKFVNKRTKNTVYIYGVGRPDQSQRQPQTEVTHS